MTTRSEFCGECGAPIEPGQTFCGECGTPVEPVRSAIEPEDDVSDVVPQPQELDDLSLAAPAPAAPAAPVEIETPPPAKADAPSPDAPASRRPMLIAVIAVLLLATAGGAYVMLGRGVAPTSQAPAAPAPAAAAAPAPVPPSTTPAPAATNQSVTRAPAEAAPDRDIHTPAATATPPPQQKRSSPDQPAIEMKPVTRDGTPPDVRVAPIADDRKQPRVPETRETVSTTATATRKYSGPTTGTIRWTGIIDRDGVLTLDGDQPSNGTMTGALPGVPVLIQVLTRDVSIAEPPSADTGWKRVTVRSRVLLSSLILQWTVLP